MAFFIETAAPYRNGEESSFQLNKRYQRGALVALVIIGIILRLFHFFDNRSFWTDELYLNINLVKMGFLELATLPMEYEQKAPLGYLWAVKLTTLLFGEKEMALRLFSLICGVGSLCLFIPVARHFLKTWGVVLSVGIFALSGPLIYHTVEAKQYSTELFAAVLALFLFIKFRQSSKLSSHLIWGVCGGLLLWFSYSSIFMLAGIAVVVSISLLAEKKWACFFLNLLPFFLWLISFALVYHFYLGKYPNSGWLIDFFEVMYKAFMPLPPTEVEDMVWFARVSYLILQHPLGLLLNFGNQVADYTALQTLCRMPYLPFLLGVLGILSLLKRNRFNLALLTLPILLVLVASGLKLYPFYERFILFLAPLFIIIIAYGTETVIARMSHHRKALVPLLLVIILSPAAWNAGREAFNTDYFYKKQFNREAVLYVNDRYQPGDVVYFYWNMHHVYQYYKEAYNLKYAAVGGRDLRHLSKSKEDYYSNLLEEIGETRGINRIWLVYDPTWKNNIGDYVSRAPQWYHEKDFAPGKTLENKIYQLGFIPADSLRAGDQKVILLNTQRDKVMPANTAFGHQ